MPSSMVDLQKFLIPLEEIKLATNNFSPQRCIGGGTSNKVYKGQLQRFENRTVAIKRHDPKGSVAKNDFINQLQMVSSFHHPNIITFIGYCEEDNEMIMIYEHAINGSLDHHLYEADKSHPRLRWGQRLKICIGAAKGLEYLHSCLEDNCGVIHGDVKSSIVLLDGNLEAKISGFNVSVLVPGNQQHTEVYTSVAGTSNSFSSESGVLTPEADVYAFGVLLLEVLRGTRSITGDQPENLTTLVRRYYDQGLYNLIDPYIRNHIDSRSFNKFTEIAYKCISFDSKHRPSMNLIIRMIQEALDIQNQQYESLEKFLIPLEIINKATNQCSEDIGEGGYGKVYKGKLPGFWENRTAAIKFLNLNGKQGKKEFLNELELISTFHHQNIIPFIGFCDEGEDMILVYEYAANGSLDKHLEKRDKMRHITWEQRLKICLGVARGMNYRHSGRGEENRVIHRDLKSANILLDDNMEAKICDFGMSRSDPDNKRNAPIYTRVAGTQFYTDPNYIGSGILTKECDVYSLGVVMFEMLIGMPAYYAKRIGGEKSQRLMNLVCRYYDDGFDKLIDPHIKTRDNNISVNMLKEIAYLCININTEKRPTMNTIIERIEEALIALDLQSDLTDYVTKDKGFILGKPITAFNIYQCLLRGNCFDTENTSLSRWLIQKIDKQIKKEDNNDYTVYWSSNGLVLLYFIQASLKSDDVHSVGFLFSQNLISYVEKLYGIICENFKTKLKSLLTLHIVAPPRSESSHEKDSGYKDWKILVDFLNTILSTLKENYVHFIIVQKIFCQLFTLINVELFNRILVKPEYCTYNNAIYYRCGLKALEKWCIEATKKYTSGSWDKLQHLRDTVELLVFLEDFFDSKGILPSKNIFHILGHFQLDKICRFYCEINNITSNAVHGTLSPATPAILFIMRLVWEDSNWKDNESFLLEDDSSVPFLVKDLLKVKRFLGAKHVPVLAKYPAFRFIYDY